MSKSSKYEALSSSDECTPALEVDLADAVETLPSFSLNNTLSLRCAFILSSEFCERLAFYSISANLILFLTNNLGLEKGTSNSLALFWSGTCYITPLLGAWIADSLWGRFPTILVFLAVYIVGMTIFSVGTIEGIDTDHSWVAFVGLFVVALGTGGLKSNVITFGADQFQGAFTEITEQEKEKEKFFRWFYFSINLGSAISYTGIAYVQQNISFSIGIGIAAGIMFLSGVLFVMGTSWYVKQPPTGSIIQRGLSLIFYSFRIPSEQKSQAPTFLDRATFVTNSLGVRKFSNTEIAHMKLFSRLFPILFPFIVFGTLYSQMSSAFFTQGTVLNLNLGGFELPISSLHLFNTVGVLVLIPVIDRLLFPCLTIFSITFPLLKRIAFGFLLVSIGMIYAGGLEVYRLHLFREGHVITQKIGNTNVTAVDLTILAQAPAYFLIAAGEVFAMTTGLEFMYSQAPPTMRSMVMALFYLTQSLGSYLGAAIVAIINIITSPNEWIGQDLNRSHLDLYFFFLASLGLINFFVYLPYTEFHKIASYEEIHDPHSSDHSLDTSVDSAIDELFHLKAEIGGASSDKSYNNKD